MYHFGHNLGKCWGTSHVLPVASNTALILFPRSHKLTLTEANKNQHTNETTMSHTQQGCIANEVSVFVTEGDCDLRSEHKWTSLSIASYIPAPSPRGSLRQLTEKKSIAKFETNNLWDLPTLTHDRAGSEFFQFQEHDAFETCELRNSDLSETSGRQHEDRKMSRLSSLKNLFGKATAKAPSVT
jgi:hypothetical protein